MIQVSLDHTIRLQTVSGAKNLMSDRKKGKAEKKKQEKKTDGGEK